MASQETVTQWDQSIFTAEGLITGIVYEDYQEPYLLKVPTARFTKLLAKLDAK